MPESSFQLIYDIHQAGCRAWFLAPIGFLLIILSVVSWRSRRGDTHGVPPWFAMALFGLFTVIALAVTWGDYWRLSRALDRGVAPVIVGIVSTLEPAPTYKGTERFRIGDHEFSYSRFQTKQGFHTLSSDGGPAVVGACLRLRYIDDHILRLETAAHCLTVTSGARPTE